MSALHPIMAAALSSVMPASERPRPASQTIDRLRQEINELHAERVSMLRLPFEVQVKTHDAVTNRDPDLCSEADYSLRRIDDDLVAEAADWLIDKHMDELEAKALELQDAREAEAQS